ncbi:zf-HC2 domain-containing protein [Gulosibacter chungangensis]|uniref:Mycothiol system anti-sigma-R factor n=1 Tax=Gulosibacter chungangensis TaxID=979746 RepID=A0A7J5BBM9_9MICO|nr:zf-HC2 domain-containing protein [Gulosibacter chungangensis]KAB1643553.1 mycothiol system anti-sigma-R factor [Gulosibacter chungangensis]
MSDCGCDKAKNGLEDYLRNEVAADFRAEIEAHLESCQDCSSEAHIHTVLTDVVRRTCNSEAAPETLRERVRIALRATSH